MKLLGNHYESCYSRGFNSLFRYKCITPQRIVTFCCKIGTENSIY